MKSALIGHTGFVGGNLAQQREFQHHYNSKNFRELQGQELDELVCAGVSAVKWWANQHPEEDRQQIQALQQVLSTVTAKQFVLISTIDVYPLLAEADEDFDCHGPGENHPYGAHRLAFEDFVRERFPGALVVRLPGLFGPGLKKNIIFDLLHNNCLEMINRECSFQYADTRTLWADILTARRAGLELVNLFTEPVPTSLILDRFFPTIDVGQAAGKVVHYDLRTKHAALYGGPPGYVRSQEAVLAQLESFVNSYQRG